MDTRWPGLPILLALTASVASAQPDRPSHRPLDNDLAAESSPEKLLSERLRKPRAEKGVVEQARFDDDLRKLAKRLMEDRELRESLLKSVDRNDVERLKRTLDANRDLANDPALLKLVKDGLANEKLSEQEKDLVKRWHDKVGSMPDRNPLMPEKNPKDPAPRPQQPNDATPAKPRPTGTDSLPRETPDWLKKGLSNGSRDFTKWLDTPAGKSFRDSLKDMSKRAGDSKPSGAGERANKVAQSLPRPGKWLTENLKPRPAPPIDARLPAPPSLARVSAGDLLRYLLVTLAVVFLLVVAWKSRGAWAGVLSRRASGWRLGPWPIAPGAVATRGDLVRAFEYLAYLRLGEPARSRHHLDLARLLPSRESEREAAETLSRLYEQARYTPDETPLSAADVEAARRDLAFLAGGAA